MGSRKMVLMILHAGSKGDTDIKNRLLDIVGKGEGGMIWENSIETYTLPYIKQIASGSLMYDTGNPKPVLWDNLQEWGREGGGRGGSKGRGYTYTYGRFMTIYGKNHKNIIIILQLKIKSYVINHNGKKSLCSTNADGFWTFVTRSKIRTKLLKQYRYLINMIHSSILNSI